MKRRDTRSALGTPSIRAAALRLRVQLGMSVAVKPLIEEDECR
jgi:hypothetical protein